MREEDIFDDEYLSHPEQNPWAARDLLDELGEKVTALEEQLADAKSAVAYGNSEIEKLLELVLKKDRELDMIKEIVRDPMVYSETMGYEAISRLGRVQELLLQRDEVERLEGEDDSK